MILVRHLAICLAALVIYLLRETFNAGNEIFWIIGLMMIFSVGIPLIAGRQASARLMLSFSAACGIPGWAALAYFTGGVGSPLTLGFAFEIILSALHAGPRGTLLVTGGAIAALWSQQLLLPTTPLPPGLWLQTALLLTAGGLIGAAAARWKLRRASLARKINALQRRLVSLEKELDDARLHGPIGARAAGRVDHLSNLVHNLKGHSQLLRSELTGTTGRRKSIAELLSSIDRLENLARDTVRSIDRTTGGHGRAAGNELLTSLDRVIAETGRSFPSIRWITKTPSCLPDVQVPQADLSEVLKILVRNAAESSRKAGEVYLSIEPRQRHLELQIRDQGDDLPENRQGDPLQPGRTSKREGAGHGLFLARQILCMYGGQLNERTAPGGGAEMSLRLPLAVDGVRDGGEHDTDPARR